MEANKHLMHNDVKKQFEHLTDWKLKIDERGQYLFKEYSFVKEGDCFNKGKQFLDELCILAEKEQHHPDLEFGWGYCNVILFTHVFKGLTQSDFNMAKEIDEIFDAQLQS
jgi:4a-hydroxytetrahydrobiopterin dehydratase